MHENLANAPLKYVQKYECKKCNYISNSKYNYQKHLNTIKHNAPKMLPTSRKNMLDIFHCKKCDYTTHNKQNYQKHIDTKKHNAPQNARSMNKKLRFDYICDYCDFKSNNISNYKSHLHTIKHKYKKIEKTSEESNKKVAMVKSPYYISNCIVEKQNYYETIQEVINAPNRCYKCPCGRSYQHYQSLNRHKLCCDYVTMEKSNNNSYIQQPNIVININNINNSNTVKNKSFNVMNYLNTTCKDAYNIESLFDNLKFDDFMKLPHDPEEFYKQSFVNLFKGMDSEQRPLQCSDVKRLSFYAKTENNGWVKDHDIRKTFTELVNRLCRLTSQIYVRFPNWENEERIEDTKLAFMQNIGKGYDDKLVQKILNFAANITKVQKSLGMTV